VRQLPLSLKNATGILNEGYSLFELRSNNEKPYSTEHWFLYLFKCQMI
jgi:hypothetical protein